jgi:hypothetical protein
MREKRRHSVVAGSFESGSFNDIECQHPKFPSHVRRHFEVSNLSSVPASKINMKMAYVSNKTDIPNRKYG